MPARPAHRRALTRIAAGVDRATLRAMRRIWLAGGDPTREEVRARQSRIFATYAEPGPDPEAFFPAPGPAALEVRRSLPIPGGRLEQVRWPSGYRTWDPAYREEYAAYAANRTAWAEWWRHREGGRPTAICLHSWATHHRALQREVFAVRRLYRAGWDVLLPVLPFHGPRTPRQAWFGGQLFPGTDPQRTNEAFGQAAWDLRALIGALRARGAGPIGLMGVSLGGYTTALLAGLVENLAFAVPILPMVRFADLLWHHGRGGPHRARAEAGGVTLERLRAVYRVHCPLGLAPRLPWERRLIVAGRGDRVCPPAHVDALWEHWERPRRLWSDGGHIAHFGRRRLLRELHRFVEGHRRGPR